ncbi:MAG: competence/damage-inducible protein A [Oscillospiraceae bacterium]|nr:competence/damage-inducible protein A [Oscillospiraceae bacterium]
MKAEIIAVGTELLLGDILNTNAQFLSQELAELGFSVFYQTVVGDNAARLEETVRAAAARSDLLIFSGGLGPTGDDLTKETVARAFDDPLRFDEDEMKKIEAFFASIGRPMTENNRKQAMVPVHGGKFQNPNGTAPGVYFEKDGKTAVLLPGPPRELRPMFENEVKPFLCRFQNAVIKSLTLRITGVGESNLEPMVARFLDEANPSAALYAKDGEVHLRVTARAQGEEEALRLCSEKAREIEAALPGLVYGYDDETLEEVVVHLLKGQGKTLATAESCTGGLISQRITSVAGASEVFGFGVCSYANEIKHRVLGVTEEALQKYGAVSPQTAAQMAEGAARLAEADYAVSVTGIAGPGGGTAEKPVGLVWMGLYSPQGIQTIELRLGDVGREQVRWRTSQKALNAVRRLCLGLPVEENL